MKHIIKNNLVIFGFLPFIIGLITSFSLPPYNLILINFITFPILLFIVFALKQKKKKQKFSLELDGCLVLDIFFLIFTGLHIL